jgi:prepilin-type N-terminal cleavage/methylation domain-containing protein
MFKKLPNYLKKIILPDNHGFSLMELLVSMSVFVIVATASLSIYASILKAGQRTTLLTGIQQESQLIMTVLAKKIRTSRLNYDYAGYADGIQEPEIELSLTDLVGDSYLFKYDAENTTLSVTVTPSDGVAGEEKLMPASQVKIDDLKFFINPKTNPFSLDAPPTSQPYVTIVMTVSSTKGKQSASLVIQQTVPQRSGGVVD